MYTIMKYRTLGKTKYSVSEIGFGAWAIGGSWGSVPEDEAIAALHTAIDMGVNFIDTADVYGDGRSEKIIAKVLKDRDEKIVIATKAGRRLDPHVADGYTMENIEKFAERSLQNLQVDALDLLQLHCPPTDVYYKPELFAGLDELKKKGKIKHFGVSVEKVEEAIKTMEYEGVATVQIIFNMFRQRPSELFFQLAYEKDVGIITRVPLASGLLTGKMTADTEFAEDDHRKFNREGESFDKGETFAGVPFETGLAAVEQLKSVKPESLTMAQFALKWILQFEEVTTVIPGAKNEQQAADNTAASDAKQLSEKAMTTVNEIYKEYIMPHVHQRW